MPPKCSPGRPRIAAAFLVIVLSMLAAAPGASSAAVPTSTSSPDATVRLTPLASPTTSLAVPRSAVRPVPRGLPYCNKRIWSSKYMKPATGKRFVETFVGYVKRGKNASQAFTAASAVTGLGGIAGVAVSALASLAGDYLINYLTDKFLTQFDRYKQVRFELKVKCKLGFAPYPSLGTRGLLKLQR